MFSRIGYKIVKTPSLEMPVMPFDVFEHVLTKTLLEKGDSFRFIQIGTDMGILNDKFAQLISNYKTIGCIVESDPIVFEQLKIKYKDQSFLVLHHTYKNNVNTSKGLGSFNSSVKGCVDLFQRLSRQVSVKIRRREKKTDISNHITDAYRLIPTIKCLYDELDYQDLHLIYINAKGNEDAVVYDTFNSQVYPEIIKYKWTDMDILQNYQLKMRLLDKGYRFIDVGSNTICVKQLF